jgi:hypothetical protein
MEKHSNKQFNYDLFDLINSSNSTNSNTDLSLSLSNTAEDSVNAEILKSKNIKNSEKSNNSSSGFNDLYSENDIESFNLEKNDNDDEELIGKFSLLEAEFNNIKYQMRQKKFVLSYRCSFIKFQ